MLSFKTNMHLLKEYQCISKPDNIKGLPSKVTSSTKGYIVTKYPGDYDNKLNTLNSAIIVVDKMFDIEISVKFDHPYMMQ
jgi:hypothetical protein